MTAHRGRHGGRIAGSPTSVRLRRQLYESFDIAMLLRHFPRRCRRLRGEALESGTAAAAWSPAEAREAIETMLRFTLSLLLAPEPHRGERALRSFLQRRLVPALGLQRI